MDDNFQRKIKVILIGETFSGKTALFKTFRDGYFSASCTTVSVDFYSKKEGSMYMQVWDTAGQERYAELMSVYCASADAVILCYDISSKHTYDKLKDWTTKCDIPKNIVMVLVGCKADLKDKREVSAAMAEEEANLFHPSQAQVKFFEVSAKTGYNVETVFEYARLQVMKEKGIVENEKIHSPQCVLL